MQKPAKASGKLQPMATSLGGHDLHEPWRVGSIPQYERVLEFGLNQLLSGTSAPDGTTPPMVLLSGAGRILLNAGGMVLDPVLKVLGQFKPVGKCIFGEPGCVFGNARGFSRAPRKNGSTENTEKQTLFVKNCGVGLYHV